GQAGRGPRGRYPARLAAELLHLPGKPAGVGEQLAGRCTASLPQPLGERLGQFGLGDDDDALLGHLEAALPVVLQVVADRRVRRDLDLLVDDRPADAAVAADVHAVEQDRVLDQGEAVDADVGRQDALADVAAGDDAALADHAVVGLAAAG